MVDAKVPSLIGREEFSHEILYIKVAGYISCVALCVQDVILRK